MLGTLTEFEIEELLREHLVGRIGCSYEGRTYIIPISYAYNGKCIYGLSKEGLKLQIMRHNPKVCFEVEELKDMGNWKSVLAWGDFEELSDFDSRNEGIEIITKRNLTLISSVTTHQMPTWPFIDAAKINGVVFRIKLTERTGRFEKNDFEPLFSL